MCTSLPLEYVTVHPLSFVTMTAVYVPVIKLNTQHNRISLSSMIFLRLVDTDIMTHRQNVPTLIAQTSNSVPRTNPSG